MAGDVLRRAREQAGLSQRAVAAAAGVRQPLISRIESGREQPALTTLVTLVEACGYRLRIDIEPQPDTHDLSLLETTLRLSPQQRVDRLLTIHAISHDLRSAVRAAQGS